MQDFNLTTDANYMKRFQRITGVMNVPSSGSATLSMPHGMSGQPRYVLYGSYNGGTSWWENAMVPNPLSYAAELSSLNAVPDFPRVDHWSTNTHIVVRTVPTAFGAPARTIHFTAIIYGDYAQ